MDDAHPSELSGAASSKAKLRGAAWVEHRATKQELETEFHGALRRLNIFLLH
jgi:hypothetical protein